MTLESAERILSMHSGGGSEESGKVVVLGIERPLGWTVLRKLVSVRTPVLGVYLGKKDPSLPLPSDFSTTTVDGTNVNRVSGACKGASMVIDCFEPNYSSWKRDLPVVTSNVVMGAIEAGATLAFASHVINSELDNQHQEGEVLRANASRLAKTAVARIPQMTGEGALNPLWRLIYEQVISGKKAHWVGDSEVQRSYVDVGDAADSMIQLATDPRLLGRAWNVTGGEAISGRRFIEFAFSALGMKPDIGRWGRGIVLTGGVFATDAAAILKMPYDYYSKFLLDGSDFQQAVPKFHFTAAAKTVANGITWYRQNVKRSKM